MTQKPQQAAAAPVEKPFDFLAFAHAWQSAMTEAMPIMIDTMSRKTKPEREEEDGSAAPDNAAIDPLHIGHVITDFWTHYAQNPTQLMELQIEYAKDMSELFQQNMRQFMGDGASVDVAPKDAVVNRRFRDPAWRDNVAFNFMRQGYIIARRTIEKSLKDARHLSVHDRQKLEFFTRGLLDALSPGNFAATNPEVIRETLRTGGENLIKGLQNFVADLKRGDGDLKIRTTDDHFFAVGKNLGVTPGSVVFRNRMMEVIQYTPTTKTVHAVPLLIIPPWINKYYILDLRPENSFVKFAVDCRFTVFMISWANPDASFADVMFDDYLKDGAIAALDVIENITGTATTNIVGYCIGGTLTAMLAAYLAHKKQNARVASMTMITTLLDFARAGDMKVFIDDAQISSIEDQMKKNGFLPANILQKTFSMLRANDMVWSFFVNNYMMGRDPFPFDILYWNDDSTNLPAAFHGDYLRQMYLHNNLIKLGAYEIAGVKVDLSTLKTPVYFLSTRDDHIAPWGATYDGAALLSRTNRHVRFTLAASGHVAGVVNPPGAQKYGYWVEKMRARGARSRLPDRCEDWFLKTDYKNGSWWGDWAKWVAKKSGVRVKPPRTGSKKYPVLGAAPGEYVHQKPDEGVKT